jgi:saccharopine dehydrogenase-like NADP-dependent oxidoreductase
MGIPFSPFPRQEATAASILAMLMHHSKIEDSGLFKNEILRKLKNMSQPQKANLKKHSYHLTIHFEKFSIRIHL